MGISEKNKFLVLGKVWLPSMKSSLSMSLSILFINIAAAGLFENIKKIRHKALN